MGQKTGLKHQVLYGKKTLEDIQIIDGKRLNDKMAHIEIENHNLIITIDFETNDRFAIVEYLQLADKVVGKWCFSNKASGTRTNSPSNARWRSQGQSAPNSPAK